MDSTKEEVWPLWIKVSEWLLAPFRASDYSIKRDSTQKFDELNQVSYRDLREQIQDGDLLFCGGEYAFSKLIRYLSGRSRVSHVGIVYWWNGRLMLLESVETDGVRVVPVSQYLVNYENSGKPYNGRVYLARERRLHMALASRGAAGGRESNSMVLELLREAATLLNKKFSFRDVLIFFWQGNTGRERHEDDDQFLCSEFVAKCFERIGITYPDDGRGFIAPEHIAMSEDVEGLVEICRD